MSIRKIAGNLLFQFLVETLIDFILLLPLPYFPLRSVYARTSTHSRILGRLEYVRLTAVLLRLVCLVKHIRPLTVVPLTHLRYLQPA